MVVKVETATAFWTRCLAANWRAAALPASVQKGKELHLVIFPAFLLLKPRAHPLRFRESIEESGCHHKYRTRGSLSKNAGRWSPALATKFSQSRATVPFPPNTSQIFRFSEPKKIPYRSIGMTPTATHDDDHNAETPSGNWNRLFLRRAFIEVCQRLCPATAKWTRQPAAPSQAPNACSACSCPGSHGRSTFGGSRAERLHWPSPN